MTAPFHESVSWRVRGARQALALRLAPWLGPPRPLPHPDLRKHLHDLWTGEHLTEIPSGLPDSYHESVYECVDLMLEVIEGERRAA